MGKKGNWFSALKKVFIPSPKEKVVHVSKQFSILVWHPHEYFPLQLGIKNESHLEICDVLSEGAREERCEGEKEMGSWEVETGRDNCPNTSL